MVRVKEKRCFSISEHGYVTPQPLPDCGAAVRLVSSRPADRCCNAGALRAQLKVTAPTICSSPATQTERLRRQLDAAFEEAREIGRFLEAQPFGDLTDGHVGIGKVALGFEKYTFVQQLLSAATREPLADCAEVSTADTQAFGELGHAGLLMVMGFDQLLKAGEVRFATFMMA